MEGEGRGDDRILPIEICQLKSLGAVTRFFGIAFGYGKFVIRMWDDGNWDRE